MPISSCVVPARKQSCPIAPGGNHGQRAMTVNTVPNCCCEQMFRQKPDQQTHTQTAGITGMLFPQLFQLRNARVPHLFALCIHAQGEVMVAVGIHTFALHMKNAHRFNRIGKRPIIEIKTTPTISNTFVVMFYFLSDDGLINRPTNFFMVASFTITFKISRIIGQKFLPTFV